MMPLPGWGWGDAIRSVEYEGHVLINKLSPNRHDSFRIWGDGLVSIELAQATM